MLLMNDMGEFVDDYDPSGDGQRMETYSSLRVLDPKKMRVRDCAQGRGERARCPMCGKEFTRTQPTRKYCCRQCSSKAKRLRERDRRLGGRTA